MAENTELDATALESTDTNQQLDLQSLMSSGRQEGVLNTAVTTAPIQPPAQAESKDPLGDAMRYARYTTREDLHNKINPPKAIGDNYMYEKGPSVRTLDADSIANFTQQENYNPEGFNPQDPTNYARFAANETWGSALAKGFDSMSSKFGSAFKENFVGYGRIGSAIMNMDFAQLMPSEDEMMVQYYKDQKDAQKNFVFETPENEDSLFSKRTVSEFIGSSGFMLGTFGAMSLEIAADVLITAATVPTGGEGAVSFIPTFAKIGAGFSRMMGKEAVKVGAKDVATTAARNANFISDAAQGFTLGNKSVEEIRLLNKINEASTVANTTGSIARQALNETFTVFSGNISGILKSKSIAEMTGNIAKGLPLIGTGVRYGEKVAAGAAAGLSAGKLFGLGAQGLRRVTQELNMSATEASFEAVSSYGDTLNKLIQDHRNNNNGENPDAVQFEDMKTSAMLSSSSNYKTNMAILLATNKLQFGNMFTKYMPANKTMRELLEATKDNLLLVEAKGMKKFYKKGFAGAYGTVGQIAKDFGKKEATYQVGKAFFKDMTRFELVEGLQENLQDISSNGWKDYYIGQYQKSQSTLSDSFGTAFENEFSKQGLKTFLMGALTGTIVRLPVHTTTKALEHFSEKMAARQYANTPNDNPIVNVKKQFDKDISTLNTFFKQTEERNFKHKIINFTNQVQEGQNQTEAAVKGLRYEFENSRDNALVSAISAAKRTDSIDVLQRAVKDMGVDMTNEDFEKSFGVKLEDTKYATAQDFSNNLSRDIKKYSDVSDGLRNKVKTFAEPTLYTPGTKDYYTAVITRSAQEDAIHTIAMNAVKGNMTAERAHKISQELLGNKSIANSSDYVIRVLTDPKILNDELGNIMADLRIAENNIAQNTDPALNKKLKKQLEQKQKEFDALEEWLKYFSNRKDISNITNEEGEAETQINKVLDTFIGEKINKNQIITDEDGNEIEEVNVTFDTHSEKVIKTFRTLLNIKNKQAGIDMEISYAEMTDVHQKLVDYMKLDKDTKDYMGAVDALMNPENFKFAIGKMSDGKMKYQVLSYLLLFEDRIQSSIFGEEGLVKAIESMDVKLNAMDIVLLYEEMRTAIYENVNYKNLMTVTLDPNLGLNNATYTQTLIDNLQKDITTKFTELTKRYAPTEYQNDITDEEYDNIIVTGKIETIREQLLIDKIARGEIELGPNELKIVNSEVFKTQIETKVAIAKQNLPQAEVIAPKTYEDSEGKWGVVADSGEVINEGYNTEEEAVAAAQAETNTSIIPVSVIPETTPGQEYVGLSLKELQHKLDAVVEDYDLGAQTDATKEELDALLQERRYILDAINKLANNIPASNAPETAPIVTTPEVTLPSVPENLNIVDAAADEQFSRGVKAEETEDMGFDSSDMLRKLLGETTTEEPFTVETNETEGFNIVDESKNVLETVKTEEEAVKISTSSNITRENIKFSNKFMKEGAKIFNIPESILTNANMISRGERSMKLFNFKNGTEFKTLKEFYSTIDGKNRLEAIRESVITGKAVKYKTKKVTIAQPVEETQTNIFDVVNTPNVLSLKLNSLKAVNKELSDFKTKTEESSKEISKFVKEGAVTETSIIQQLKDAAACFK